MISSAPASASSAILPPTRDVSAAGAGAGASAVPTSESYAPQDGQNGPARTPCQPQVAQGGGATSMSRPSSVTAHHFGEYAHK
jgi:hypothetical protein